MVGVTTARGTVLKGLSMRKVESHSSGAIFSAEFLSSQMALVSRRHKTQSAQASLVESGEKERARQRPSRV